MTYHVARDGVMLGEFSEVAFREKVFDGEVLPEDHYWCEGMTDWRPIAEFRIAAKTQRLIPLPEPVRPRSPAQLMQDPKIPFGSKVCVNCGNIGKPVTITKGTFAMELLLWLCLFVPGLLYSIWRLSSRYSACPKCEAPNMIPVDSPVAQKFLADRV